ncbi:hypothetical protein NC653_041911 [Populus alba x Populus x berolinensis]|nr:hypothetical protein NC653_041911 [Populus alba x Populus x berolinensis]
MKITKFAVLSFLLFAFTATSIFPHAVHAQDPEAVIDVNGNEVTADARYFIGAASDDNTTTLAVSATSRIICNSDVIISSMSNGLPVTFSSPVGESGDGTVIREDSYLNVNFVAATCRMAGVSTMWKTELRPTMRGFVVTTGGVDGLNRFKITKYEGDSTMKITNFLVLSFLLFAFTATSIFPRAVHAEAVIDAFGDEVKAGDRYIIGAASNDFAVTATSPIICNSDVVFSPMSNGLPVIFSKVVESNDSVINEDSYLNVDFVAPSCRMAGVSTMWKIELRLTARGFVVTTGGVAGLNRFTITKYEGGNNLYQLSYCPISEPICECSCVPLGNVVNRLAPSTIPFPVVFIPADRASKIEYKMM